MRQPIIYDPNKGVISGNCALNYSRCIKKVPATDNFCYGCNVYKSYFKK